MAGLVRQLFTKIINANNSNTRNILPSCLSNYNNYTSLIARSYSNAATTPYEIVPADNTQNKKVAQDVFDQVNGLVAKSQQGRLFAVVHVAGKQFKVTEGDVIIIEGYWPPDAGDRISLDKVMLVGGADFTLIGRPLVQPGLVNVQGVVIEKSLSHTKTHFRKKRRKQYMRINFYRVPHTLLRINTIAIVGEINNPPQITGLDNRIF